MFHHALKDNRVVNCVSPASVSSSWQPHAVGQSLMALSRTNLKNRNPKTNLIYEQGFADEGFVGLKATVELAPFIPSCHGAPLESSKTRPSYPL